jgi:hypothetical protein
MEEDKMETNIDEAEKLKNLGNDAFKNGKN